MKKIPQRITKSTLEKVKNICYNSVKTWEEGKKTDSPMTAIWRSEYDALIRMCDYEGEYSGRICSEYERFETLCHLYPLWENTDSAKRFLQDLRERYGYEGQIGGDAAAMIWEIAVCGEAEMPPSERVSLSRPWLSECTDIPMQKLLRKLSDVQNAYSFFCDYFSDCKKYKINVDASWLHFFRVDSYHAGMAWERKKRGEENADDDALIRGWLMGCLARALSEYGGELHLLTDGDVSTMLAALRYWKERTFLPNTWLCLCQQTEDLHSLSEMLGAHTMGKKHAFIGLDIRHASQEQIAALSAWYPMGVARK